MNSKTLDLWERIDKIVNILKYIKPIDGRLEVIGKTKDNSIVILDYAHTPEALKTCIENVKEQFSSRKINIVFGCGGNRDKQKRPIMGKIANNLCNSIYLTDDNPRGCLLYTSPSPRDRTRSRMPSSA